MRYYLSVYTLQPANSLQRMLVEESQEWHGCLIESDASRAACLEKMSACVGHCKHPYIIHAGKDTFVLETLKEVIDYVNDKLQSGTVAECSQPNEETEQFKPQQIEYPHSEALVSRDGVIGIVANVVEVEGAAGYLCYQGFLSPSMHGFIYDGGYALADEVAPISYEQYKILAKEIFKLHKQAEIVENSMRAVFRAQKTGKPQYITYQSKMNNEPCTTR